jgi:hypothetical protein
MPTATYNGNIANEKYKAGSSANVSPLVLFMFYWTDSFDYTTAAMDTANFKTRKLPFDPKGLYTD